MENSTREKLDHNLQNIYDNYLDRLKNKTGENAEPETRRDVTSYNLSLRYENGLSEIENLGYKTSWKELPGMAHGYVDLKNLEAIASHPNVISISAGAKREKKLDHSVKDIKVRSDTAANVGTNGRWFMDAMTGAITAPAVNGLTGKGVIIGIIDSGIDISHPCFRLGGPMTFTSRILSYWDQDLLPVDANNRTGPPTDLLGVSTHTYGVHFDKNAIESLINTRAKCPSRDCLGHGTHVTGIAAGNGNGGEGLPPAIPKPKFNFAGVAPEADIVVVKYLDTGTPIDTVPNFVSETQQFKDAFYYILKIAKKATKAAVINCSFGRSLGPHDGLTEDEQFLDGLFGPASEYYKGNIAVYSAGNDAGSRVHAQITIPASGEITIPFTLYDTRSPKEMKEFELCNWADSTKPLIVDMWYKKPASDNAVAVQVKVPGDAMFSNKLFHGNIWKIFDKNKKRTLTHTQVPPVNRPLTAGGTVAVHRNNIQLIVEPNENTNPYQHKTGIYELKVSAPAGTVLHAWCHQLGRLGFLAGAFTWLTQKASAGDRK